MYHHQIRGLFLCWNQNRKWSGINMWISEIISREKVGNERKKERDKNHLLIFYSLIPLWSPIFTHLHFDAKISNVNAHHRWMCRFIRVHQTANFRLNACLFVCFWFFLFYFAIGDHKIDIEKVESNIAIEIHSTVRLFGIHSLKKIIIIIFNTHIMAPV